MKILLAPDIVRQEGACESDKDHTPQSPLKWGTVLQMGPIT